MKKIVFLSFLFIFTSCSSSPASENSKNVNNNVVSQSFVQEETRFDPIAESSENESNNLLSQNFIEEKTNVDTIELKEECNSITQISGYEPKILSWKSVFSAYVRAKALTQEKGDFYLELFSENCSSIEDKTKMQACNILKSKDIKNIDKIEWVNEYRKMTLMSFVDWSGYCSTLSSDLKWDCEYLRLLMEEANESSSKKTVFNLNSYKSKLDSYFTEQCVKIKN